MVNALTRHTGVKIGPLLFETLVKHYFDRLVKESESQGRKSTNLRRDELLYDEAFNVVKTFLEASTKHTVEELQKFSNTRTPAPPWVHVVKLLVPMSCCDEAATIVIQALGGEEMTKHIVGGTKWWQVRGVKGVNAEWIATKKDWQEAKRRFKQRGAGRASNDDHARRSTSGSTDSGHEGVPQDAPPDYHPDMDEMRCILYTHGGGYYFGSVDQERYAIQRFARKINGRVFAINYRLAPQYPFPCALQDVLAAYLFLIRPPEGASHRPVNPAHIVVAGDSAGGGLTIALLQVLRDCGLPLPAGATLISPWCDLTHSFPSIHTNTATDVLPPYGLSFYKPSTLWPPPSDDLNTEVRERLRTRIRQAVRMTSKDPTTLASPIKSRPVTPSGGGNDLRLPQTGQTLHLGSTASLPHIPTDSRDQTVTCVTAAGETLQIQQQIHLYAPNYLLGHPLVSPVVSYMGGLCPLLIIAGDAEVLRDEIIYLAHKAADPTKFPITQEAQEMYPALKGIEERFGPTPVHLQVYDDAAHILPILFSFTTPAKYCFRAISSFTRHVTGLPPLTTSDSIGQIPVTLSPPTSPGLGTPSSDRFLSAEDVRLGGASERQLHAHSSPPSCEASPRPLTTPPQQRVSLRRTLSSHVSRAGLLFARGTQTPPRQASPPLAGVTPERDESGDAAGPRFFGSGMKNEDERHAGEAAVYLNGLVPGTMLRERVSTHGVIRALEPEDELSAFSLPPELIGVVSELAMRRYHDAHVRFARKFSGTTHTIEARRRRNLDTAHRDAQRSMQQLQAYFSGKEKSERFVGLKAGVPARGSWSWAWALDADERPPPSSIVARRDTQEAVELARIADQAVLSEEDVIMSGNNLWSLVVSFLTASPDKGHKHHDHSHDQQAADTRESNRERIRSRWAQLVSDRKKQPASSDPTSR
ncbi:hypothetical protein PHLGIDRAFT_21763 [Phlebiopsis gigantea 11061_1 CR5-6]|uniref:Alpha/beta hydrolase fold-3 domain-containing protein n=1 Tax=Phlebiopsis gigantea (strain 11061_1 CR5-6) TaxID=745531 RepID=A0A0C3S5M7_PHLG1|nr:hypothetical protein PHLGIDRAFT_21763 [Phlebiopsis gigantea 11061_1 CR5-6]